jgi:hypothetical protein
MTTAISELEQVLDLTARLSAVDQLRLIERLVAQVRAQQENEAASVDILSLVGVGADLWQQIDVDTYLKQERANWEH